MIDRVYKNKTVYNVLNFLVHAFSHISAVRMNHGSLLNQAITSQQNQPKYPGGPHTLKLTMLHVNEQHPVLLY